jgi:DIM1 family U5 snRNP protein
MSYLLPHLRSGWAVDQAILSEEGRVVILRFGHDWDPTCKLSNISIFNSSSVKRV